MSTVRRLCACCQLPHDPLNWPMGTHYPQHKTWVQVRHKWGDLDEQRVFAFEHGNYKLLLKWRA